MASIADGWRPRRCLRHDQPAIERRSLLVDNLLDSVLSVQVRNVRIPDWPLCDGCLEAQRRARWLAAGTSIATLGYVWLLLTHAAGQSFVTQLILALAFVALWSLDVAVGRRALMPALSAGLRLSGDRATLAVKTRLGDPSVQAELEDVSASRWH
jgi:hypothetical protein